MEARARGDQRDAATNAESRGEGELIAIGDASRVKRLALVCVFCVALLLVLTYINFPVGRVIAAFALIGAAVAGWLVVFEGGTIISHALNGAARRNFNIAMAIAIPAITSLWFLRGSSSFDFCTAFNLLASPSAWVILFLLAAVGWGAADQMDRQHSFRGFLIASTVLWIIHAAPEGTWCVDSEDDPNYCASETSPINSASHFGGFVTEVTAIYSAMALKLTRSKP